MADAPISSLTQFSPQGHMLIPAVDPTASPGLKNGYVLVSDLAVAGGQDDTPSGLIQNPATISSALAISAASNAVLVGPVLVSAEGSITVPLGSNLRIL